MKSFSRSRSGPKSDIPGHPRRLRSRHDTRHQARRLGARAARPARPSAMRTWTTQAVDIRLTRRLPPRLPASCSSIGAKQTVSSDRIIGCPHEEGMDYPLGRTCPRCPFWAGIDRFTHEPVTPPVHNGAGGDPGGSVVRRSGATCRSAGVGDGHRSVLVEPLLAQSIAASPIHRVLRRKRRRSSLTRCTCSPSGVSLVPTPTWSDGCRCRARRLGDCRRCRHPGRRADSGCGLRWRPEPIKALVVDRSANDSAVAPA